jgi:hypothetical protein
LISLLGVDLESIVLQVWITSPVEEANTLLNGGPALLGESDSELDHVGSLCIAQLRVIALIGVNAEDIHGHVDRTLGIFLVMRTTGIPGMQLIPYFDLK